MTELRNRFLAFVIKIKMTLKQRPKATASCGKFPVRPLVYNKGVETILAISSFGTQHIAFSSD